MTRIRRTDKGNLLLQFKVIAGHQMLASSRKCFGGEDIHEMLP